MIMHMCCLHMHVHAHVLFHVGIHVFICSMFSLACHQGTARTSSLQLSNHVAVVAVAQQAAAAQPVPVLSIPTKRDVAKMKWLSRQVLGLSQAELDSGDWNAD